MMWPVMLWLANRMAEHAISAVLSAVWIRISKFMLLHLPVVLSRGRYDKMVKASEERDSYEHALRVERESKRQVLLERDALIDRSKGSPKWQQ